MYSITSIFSVWMLGVGCPEKTEIEHVEVLPSYFIVGTHSLMEGAELFAQYRQESGFEVSLLSRSSFSQDPHLFLGEIREVLQNSDPQSIPYLLLIGDTKGVESHSGDEIPTFSCENDLGGCYSDNPYADLDGDSFPDVMVGRILAKSTDDVRAYLDKVRLHDTEREIGPWNRRMSLYAGYSGFGDVIERMLENMMLEGLARMDPATEIIGLYNNPLSSFYYIPFEEKVVDIFDEGSILTLYVGHGQAAVSEGLDATALYQIENDNKKPFLAFFACNNGKFAQEQDSIAELSLFYSDGPIGVWAASNITHPYANGLGPYELQRAIFEEGYTSFGEAVLHTKYAWFENADASFREYLDQFLIFFQLSEEEAERTMLQHLNLYNYFGDPAARIHLPPNRISVQASGSAQEGTVQVQALIPELEHAQAIVSIEVPRDVLAGTLQEIDAQEPDVETVQQNWSQAVDTALVREQVEVVEGQLQLSLSFAPQISQPLYVKVYAWNEHSEAYGYTNAP